MGKTNRINPLDNYLFYKVMGEKGDEVQLLGFLNAVLGYSGENRLQSVEIMDNTAFIKDFEEGKTCILDVLAVLGNGTKVNIEVQLGNEHNMERRSLFYWSKVFTESIDAGQDYKELPNVVAINIVDFNFQPGDKYHTVYRLKEKSDPTVELTSALEIHFLNMVQWRRHRNKDLRNNALHRWLTWFDDKSKPDLIKEVITMDGAVAEAYKKLEEAMKDQNDYRRYWAHRKYEHDMVSRLNYAHDKGLEMGQDQKALEIARKMKEMNESIEKICIITGLSAEAVQKL